MRVICLLNYSDSRGGQRCFPDTGVILSCSCASYNLCSCSVQSHIIVSLYFYVCHPCITFLLFFQLRRIPCHCIFLWKIFSVQVFADSYVWCVSVLLCYKMSLPVSQFTVKCMSCIFTPISIRH